MPKSDTENNRLAPPRAVVLLSGGLDSAILLRFVHQRIGVEHLYCLSFHYGQKHARELACAEYQARQCPAVRDWRVVDIGVLGSLTAGASALTDQAIAVPELKAIPMTERHQPITYVPNRNLIMLSLAAAYAESRQCPVLYYGAQAQDEYGYWDCTSTFVARVNATLALNRRHPITIQAPFGGKRKAEEIRLGLELGVDFAHTWSCYRGGEQPCGVCPACVERAQAFAEVGLADPSLPPASTG